MANKTQQAQPSKLRRKLDSFWMTLFLTPEGKPKSALLLYSFCMSLVFVVVYCIAYFFLIDVLEHAFAATATVAVRNVLQSVLPGLAGTLVCCLAWFIPGDKRLLPYAYLWLCAFALAVLILMIFLLDHDAYSVFFYFFMTLVPVGLVSGMAASQVIYRKWRRKEEAANAPKK